MLTSYAKGNIGNLSRNELSELLCDGFLMIHRTPTPLQSNIARLTKLKHREKIHSKTQHPYGGADLKGGWLTDRVKYFHYSIHVYNL